MLEIAGEGFDLIQPLISSRQAGAMLMGARLLDKLGRQAESEQPAQAIIDRYPDSPSFRAFLAGLYWRHAKFQEAAQTLKAMENLELPVQSYRFFEKARGKPAALDWLRRSVPPQLRGPLGMIAYSRKQYGLEWDLVANPGKGRNADVVWVLRAAASDMPGPDNCETVSMRLYRMRIWDRYNRDSSGTNLHVPGVQFLFRL